MLRRTNKYQTLTLPHHPPHHIYKPIPFPTLTLFFWQIKRANQTTAIASPTPPREVPQGPPPPMSHHNHHPIPHQRKSTPLPPPLPPPLPLPPPPQQQQLPRPEGVALWKQHSWSPDIYRDEAWIRRKGNIKKRRSKSVTDEDLDELKGCIELGFGFDSPDLQVDQRLSDTLPALEFYYAVNKNYNDSVTKASTSPALSTASDCESSSSLDSPHAIFGQGKILIVFRFFLYTPTQMKMILSSMINAVEL